MALYSPLFTGKWLQLDVQVAGVESVIQLFA